MQRFRTGPAILGSIVVFAIARPLSGMTSAMGQLANGDSDTVTFDTAGTFDYVCSIHPQMTGSVVVEAAAATPAPTDAPTAAPTTGGGVTITPAPTDAEPGASDDGAYTAVAWALAVLGVVMLVGTLVADRRFRARD